MENGIKDAINLVVMVDMLSKQMQLVISNRIKYYKKNQNILVLLTGYRTASNSSLIAYATTSYNTGWMHGDIKGAFLSDTDTTNVNAGTTNLVTNGTFDSG